MVKTIKKLLPKSVIGWIFFIIAGNWIAYFFMNAHSIFDKLNKSVPSWIGMVIFFGIFLWGLGAKLDNNDDDMFDNHYDDYDDIPTKRIDITRDPIYAGFPNNVFSDDILRD